MEFVDALKIVKEEANKINSNINSDMYIKVYAGKEHLDIHPQDRTYYDYRLYDKSYIDYSISFEINSRKDKKKLGHATFYVLPREVYNSIYFWKYNKDEGKLVKVYIGQVEDDLGDTIINMAFGILFEDADLVDTVVNKAAYIKLYIDIYIKITDKTYTLAEPTGLYACNKELNEKDILYEKDVGGFERIGMVLEESNAAFRLIKYLGFKQIVDIYHHISLGPIYSKNKYQTFTSDRRMS